MIFFIFSKFIFQYHFIGLATCVFKVLIPPLGTRIQSEEMFIAGTRISVEEKTSWQMCDEFIAIRLVFGFWDCEKKLKLLCTWWNAGVPDRFPRSCATSGAVHRRPPFFFASIAVISISGPDFVIVFEGPGNVYSHMSHLCHCFGQWHSCWGFLLVQVHVFTFEHLEVGRLNSGRESVQKGREGRDRGHNFR